MATTAPIRTVSIATVTASQLVRDLDDGWTVGSPAVAAEAEPDVDFGEA